MTGDDDDDLLREFLLESAENLTRLDQDFVALEREPNDRERLGAVFRTIHTIKGTSGFFDLSRLESLTHAGETLLSRLRDGELALDGATTSALLTMVDAVREMLASIEADGSEGSLDIAPIVAELARVGEAPRDAPPAPSSGSDAEGAPSSRGSSAAPASTERAAPRAASERAATRAPASADTTIRVDVGLLDDVMNMVGELVLARNQIVQLGRTVTDPSFVKASQRLDLLTTELQAGIMKTRMQPIGSAWNKLPRVVRDLAHVCGKRVDIELDGAETDLDRTIIEAIKAPLTHVVRNAVDHGIETPAERRAAGKPERGCLSLRAFHEGGQVNIEVSDDGAGLDVARIRARVVERGLLTAERAAQLSDRETMRLVFEPGFSTADRVTSVSGRGVGMDVVRTNIEKIGGVVDISSALGRGTTLKIKIPLTLAIIPALIVTTRAERFAVPQVSLLELVRLEGEQLRSGLEEIGGATLYRLRGALLPLVFLDRALELTAGASLPSPGEDGLTVVVVQADERQFGLVVDGIHDTEEIVVKPLGKELKGIGVFAGATIMGDGRVALILDLLGLARRAGVISETRARVITDRVSAAAIEPREQLVLCRVGDDGRMAVPLSLIARIEEIDRSAIEKTSGGDVVQHRGEILPLVDLSRLFGRPSRSTGSLHVLVCAAESATAGRSVGLVVEQVLDIVEDTGAARQRATRPGVLAAVILQEKVVELLDVPWVVETATRPSESAVAA